MNAPTKPEKPAAEYDPNGCQAGGCPLRGTVGDGGRFRCHCHAWAPPERWGQITHQIHQHDWMLKLMRRIKADDIGNGWRKTAADLWANSDPHMLPHADENRALYLYRLVLDFEFRVGARVSRPGPQLPQGLQRQPSAVAARNNLQLPQVAEAAW